METATITATAVDLFTTEAKVIGTGIDRVPAFNWDQTLEYIGIDQK